MQEYMKNMSGLAGAIAALLWIRASPARLMAYVVGGAAAAYYAAPTVSRLLTIDLALSGFLIGLFGMATVSKLFELLDAIDGRSVFERILRRIGL